MGGAPQTPQQVVEAELRNVGPIEIVIQREEVAARVLSALADRMRDEVGPLDCGCGGCDHCSQHALIDWLDPR